MPKSWVRKAQALAVRRGRRVVQLKDIKNKSKRREIWKERKLELAKLKRRDYFKRRQLRNKYGFNAAPYITHTQESKRISDGTEIIGYDNEIEKDHKSDEFSKHFEGNTLPKILITTSINPSKKTLEFVNELIDVFPDIKYISRRFFLKNYKKNMSINSIILYGKQYKYTSLIIIHENKNNFSNGRNGLIKGYCRGPHKLLHICLPNGPSALYRLSSFKSRKEIYKGSKSTNHKPELILSNFSTRLGVRIGRMLTTLFDQRSEFRGRQVVTFRNQRDFIFFRRHRYIFNNNGNDCEIQELGPRFTLKLHYLQDGLFNPQYGKYEWKWNQDMGLQKLKWYL